MKCLSMGLSSFCLRVYFCTEFLLNSKGSKMWSSPDRRHLQASKMAVEETHVPGSRLSNVSANCSAAVWRLASSSSLWLGFSLATSTAETPDVSVSQVRLFLKDFLMDAKKPVDACSPCGRIGFGLIFEVAGIGSPPCFTLMNLRQVSV